MKRLVLIALITSPLIVGGVHSETALGLGVTLCIVNMMGLWERRARVQRQGIYVSAWALVATALAIFSMFQLLPLPAWAHAWLQPRGHSLYLQGAQVLGLDAPTPWRALSMDPGATAQAALRWWVLAMASFTGINFFRSRKHLRPLLWGLGFSAIACLLLGAAQTLLGNGLQLWWFDVGVAPRGVSTFVSLNHASAFYGLVSVTGAVVVTTTPAWERARVFGGCVMLGGAVLAIGHGSVATILTLGLCLLGFALWSVFTDRGPRAAKRALFAGVGLTTLLALGALTLLPELTADAHSARLELSVAGVRAVSAFPWVGIGGGAVERVIYPFVTLQNIGLHAVPVLENDLIELTLSVGVPVMAALAGFLLWAMVRWGRRVREVGARPLFVCVALWGLYCLLTAMVHFPTRMMGLAVPMLLVGTALNATALSSERDAQARATRLLSLRMGWAWVAGALLSMLAMYGASHALRAPADSDIPGLPAETLPQAHERIPGEGRLFLRASNLALEAKDAARAARLGAHAATLDPYPHTHALLAHAYAAAGDQARARDAYATLFRGLPSARFPTWIGAMWRDLEPGIERDVMVASLPTHLWPTVYPMAFKVRGRLESAGLVDALLEVNPDRPEAVRQWLLFYEGVGEWELVELQARDILERGASGPVEAEAQGALARALYARGLESDGAQTLADASQAFPEHVEIQMLVLRATSLGAAPPEPLLERVAEARLVVCRGPNAITYATLCGRSRAWALERGSKLEAAGEAWKSLAMRSRSPKGALDFMLRHGQCLALRKFRAEWRTRFPKDAARLRAFDSAFKACQSP